MTKPNKGQLLFFPGGGRVPMITAEELAEMKSDTSDVYFAIRAAGYLERFCLKASERFPDRSDQLGPLSIAAAGIGGQLERIRKEIQDDLRRNKPDAETP